MAVDKNLMKILACPQCKGEIKEIVMFLVCENCKLAFPVLEDVPDMVLEDSWGLEKANKHKFKHDVRL